MSPWRHHTALWHSDRGEAPSRHCVLAPQCLVCLNVPGGSRVRQSSLLPYNKTVCSLKLQSQLSEDPPLEMSHVCSNGLLISQCNNVEAVTVDLNARLRL